MIAVCTVLIDLMFCCVQELDPGWQCVLYCSCFVKEFCSSQVKSAPRYGNFV